MTHKQVKKAFEELRLILQIKKIKKGDSFKYILHGARDETTGKKAKVVSLQALTDCLQERIGFPDAEVSLKLAKFLMEKPNEEGKIELLDDAEFQGQTHAQAVTMRRKDL